MALVPPTVITRTGGREPTQLLALTRNLALVPTVAATDAAAPARGLAAVLGWVAVAGRRWRARQESASAVAVVWT